MWQTKKFRTHEAMMKWIDENRNFIEYAEVFVNNGYAVEYRMLRRIF